MATPISLRERKKARNRQLIADVAWRLFSERGFDKVSVGEIAREAEVSEATVFNYFPAKEDLVFEGLDDFEHQMLSALRARPPDRSIVEEFGRLIAEPGGLLEADNGNTPDQLLSATRIILNSRSLLARERELYDRYATSLTQLIADERNTDEHDIEAEVIARALIGIQRSLLDDVRGQVLAGADRQSIARQVRSDALRAMNLLKTGLSSSSP
jgi:AcrR family transcriptional regulator